MTTIGSKFDPPIIGKGAIPGGWVPMKPESSYIAPAIETVLDEISSSATIPANVQVTILEASSQVVSGIRVFVKFQLQQPALVIEALLYFPFSTDRSNTTPKISHLYGSSS